MCTNIASASVGNVDIVGYSELPPTKKVVSVTEMSTQFLHYKSSIPGTESGAQI